MPNVALSVLGAASNGPTPGPNAHPSMLSVGDSLMWGQGLRPDHRFRELVRLRLTNGASPVVELSMARSGAQLDPPNPQHDTVAQTQDNAVADSLLLTSTPDPLYAPDQFTREVPYSSLTTRRQLKVALKLLETEPDGAPEDIRWIILDGGINDISVANILTPAGALADGEILAGWSAWLLERARDEIQPEMVSTLSQALQDFPNASIVVNGYFPIFSSQSMFSLTRVLSFGALNAGLSTVIANPASLIAIAEASRVWQVVSNEHLRRAIRQVRRQFPGRTVTFARSRIEDSHCLFAPQSWLWGYSAVPPTVPATRAEWIQWLAGAAPEDEVINQRLARCAALQPGLDGNKCRLASIGHPNFAGAQDYADSIIEALEDDGVIPSALDGCRLQQRRRIKACIERQDSWDYTCVAKNAAMARACGRIISDLVDIVKTQAKQVGNDLERAKDHMLAARDCLKNAAGTGAQMARDQFAAAADDLGNAANQFEEALNCWNEADADMRRCEDDEARELAACDTGYNTSDNGTCNITCNSFGNCNSYSKFNPYRYVCRGLRAACVAAAAVARGICLAAALVVWGVCRAAAWARTTVCKGAVVVGDTVCSMGRAAAALGSLFVAGGRAALGIAAGSVSIAGGMGCAAGQVGLAGVDVAIAGGRAGIGAAWDLGLLGAYGTCRAGKFVVDRLCRLGATGATALCHAGSAALYGACRVAAGPRRAAHAEGMGNDL
jgi:hypothetical protein